MSSGNYSENFTDITNWTNSYASGTGASNWRVATSVATSSASQFTVFTSSTSGGVQKGSQAIIFLASGTSAGATDLLLNFSGRLAGNLSFDYAKVVNSASATPRTSDLKLQYSLDNGVTFTDFTGYTIPRVTNNNTAESGTVSFALPSALDNQSQVVVRFYFWNNGQTGGSGNRPKFSVDNLSITSTAGATPTISTTGTPSSLRTTYGTASSTTSFSVSGADMTAGILVTPPTGFEVSTDDVSYSASLTVGAAGTIDETTVYIRLAADAAAGSPSGNAVLSSDGASSADVAVSGTVSQKSVTITGLIASNKTYDGGTNASVTGTAAFEGLVNGESFTPTGTVTWAFADADVGVGKSLVASGEFDAPSSNYSVMQPILSADITAAPLTITASDANKVIGQGLTSGSGSSAFISSGLVNDETIGLVTISYGTGAAAEDAAGIYEDQAVPSDATGGTFSASNYEITYVPGDIIVTEGASLPSVISASATSVTATSATLNGNVTSDGGAEVTARGFVYSSSDATPELGEEGVTGIAASSGGTGAFNASATGLSANTEYSFRAYATNSAGTSYGSVLSFTTLKAEPTSHVASFAAGTITTSNIPATWTAASADGYLLRVSSSSVSAPSDGTAITNDTDVSDGSGSVNLAGDASSYSGFTGFTAGSTYTFAIYPYNNSESDIDYKTASAPSFQAVLLPAAPESAPTFSSVTATGFTVEWSAVTGADSYQLDVATDSEFTSIVGNDSVSDTSRAVTGLSANTVYHARVRAVNATGVSANSPSASQTTSQLAAPTTLAATDVSYNSFTANWNSVEGASGYRVDVTAVTSPSTTDLIISEYVEGSSNNKYLEIYNGTSAAVNLADYEVRTFSNGASTASFTQVLDQLPGNPTTLAAGQTIVLAHPQAALALPDGVTAYVAGTITPSFNSIFAYNGDDAVALYKISTSSYVDIFGVIGTDPGSSWAEGGHSTVDKTLRRKLSVTGGVTENPASFDTLTTEWDVYNQNTVSDLGNHSGTGFLAGFENADVGSNTSLEISGANSSTQYSYVVRATSATSTSANSDTRTVTTAAAPTISASGTLSALSTTYGTVSDTTSFSVSGAQLEAGVTITPPSGFEVSSASDFASDVGTSASPITVGSADTLESTTIYVRIAATSAAGAYSGDIVLTSSNASTVNVATASSTVSQKELSITGLNAANKGYNGNTTVNVTGTPEYSGLVNGESFSVTGSVTWAFEDGFVGNDKPLVRTGNYDAPSANYTVTQPSLVADITAVVAGAPTITDVSAGNAQLIVAFTAPAFDGGVTIIDYEYSTDDGESYTSASTTMSPILITGLTNDTTYSVKIRAVNSAGAGSSSEGVNATPTAPSTPTLLVSVDTLPGELTTTYGTASSSQSFILSGDALIGSITVTVPSGLEVSIDDSSFSGSLNLTPTNGSISNTTIYVRLAATAAVSGTYDGVSVNVSSTDATALSVSTTSSGNSVSAKGLTITGLSASNKTYDGGTSADVTGTASYDGLVNGESHSVTDSITWSFPDKAVGSAKTLVASGSYTAPNSNYTIASQPELTADITAKELTVSGAVASNKTYDGTTDATITGATLVGVIDGDTVSVSGGGVFASANASNGIAVTAALSISGADSANYSLTQPEGLSADITKATQTITFAALDDATVAVPYALAGTSSSGLELSYTSSDESIATIDGATLTPLVAGFATITASQEGDANYEAAVPVQQVLKVTNARAVLFSENMGNPSSTTSVANHNFENSDTLLFSSGDAAAAADVRTSSASSGYADASGGGNVFFTSTAGERGFAIEDIDAGNYTSLQLQFGYRKESSSSLPAFAVEYWDGTSWQVATNEGAALFDQAPNASTGWYLSKTIALIDTASRNELKLRFLKSGSISVRLDDVVLTGIPKIVPVITSAPSASAITYGQTLADSVLSEGAADVAGTFAFSNPSIVPNAGTANFSVTFSPADAAYATATVDVSVTVNVATLAEEAITLTRDGNGYSASASGVSGFSFSYSGRNGTTYGPTSTAPSVAGFYTVSATSSDANYSGSKSENYIVSGPIAADDNVSKPADGSEVKIPLSILLANDSRLDAQGNVLTTNLSITGVTSGGGNTAVLSDAFVLLVPSASEVDSFTYTLSDGTSTATGTVTVTRSEADPFFTLQLVGTGTPSFDGSNTSVTHDFLGLPNQTLEIEYSTDLETWTSVGNQSTGATGSFSVTFTAAGEQTWSTMFFRARFAANP